MLNFENVIVALVELFPDEDYQSVIGLTAVSHNLVKSLTKHRCLHA